QPARKLLLAKSRFLPSPGTTTILRDSNRPRESAAVHDQRGAGHERRRFTCQIQHRLGDLLGPADPAQRSSRCPRQKAVSRLAKLQSFVLEHIRISIARTDAVYANVLRAMVDGHRLREENDGSLRGAIRGGTRPTSQSPTGSHINDGTASVLGHQRNHQAGDRKSTRLNSSHVAISYAVFCLKKK